VNEFLYIETNLSMLEELFRWFEWIFLESFVILFEISCYYHNKADNPKITMRDTKR
jgi:hypothetical protein